MPGSREVCSPQEAGEPRKGPRGSPRCRPLQARRAETTPPINPIVGAPTSVEPKIAIDHRDITRPRMCGADSSWIIVFRVEERQMEKNPTNTIATVMRPSDGMSAAITIETQKKNA